jgi:hypothetical protein
MLDHGPTPEVRKAARVAACELRRNWKFEPVDLMPVEHGIAERAAERLRGEGLLPTEEINDSLILAESALLGCAMLLTSDSHLRDLDFQAASLALKAADLDAPVIATPREIVAKFF